MADRKNAHIRGEASTRRQDPDIKAEEAQRILDDPAFIRGFESTRNAYIKHIEEGISDGSPEFERAEREACRSLRNLFAVKRNISLAIQGQTLRLAEFQSKKDEE